MFIDRVPQCEEAEPEFVEVIASRSCGRAKDQSALTKCRSGKGKAASLDRFPRVDDILDRVNSLTIAAG